MKNILITRNIFVSALALVVVFSLYSASSSASYTVYAEESSAIAITEEAVIAVPVVESESPFVEEEKDVTEAISTSHSSATVDIFADGKDRNLTLTGNESFTLDWISANVVSCKLFADTQDLGGVSKTGSAGPIDLNHPLYPEVGGSKTYTITCLDLQDHEVLDNVVVSRLENPPSCEVPEITSSLSVNGRVGNPFSYTITTTSAGTSSVSYKASPLPEWATFSTSTGVLSGIPTQAGVFTVEIYSINQCGQTAKDLVITIAPQEGGDDQISVSLSANPSTITQGQSSTLSWNSTNATVCSASWTSATSTSGTQLVSPSATTDYSITCTKNAKTATATTTIIVTEAPVCLAPVITSPLSVNGKIGNQFSYVLTASSTGTSTVEYGLATTSLPTGLSFSTTTHSITGTPTQSGTFSVVISVRNSCGEESKTLVIAIDANGGGGNQISVSLSANPSTITQGQSSTLSWNSTNATVCSASWTSATSTSGTQLVSPSATTDYSITCTNTSMGSSATTTVTVNPQNTSGGGSRSSGRGGRSSPVPQVLGATLSCDYLKDYLKIDWQNDPIEVIKLQVFLRELEGFRSLPITGVFDQATYVAVGVFQERYEADILTPWGHEESTSFVYILTKKKVNEIVCNRALPLNTEQEKEIAGFRLFLASLKSQGIEVDVSNSLVEISQGQNKGQISTPVESILSPNGMEFVDLGSLDGADASTTGTSTTVFDGNVQNIAAAIIAGPQGWDESLNALLLFAVILLAVYLVVQAVIDNQSRDGSLSFDSRRIRKMSYFTIGVFFSILGCLLFGIYTIVLPLVTLLIILCIVTLWVTFSKKEVRAVAIAERE